MRVERQLVMRRRLRLPRPVIARRSRRILLGTAELPELVYARTSSLVSGRENPALGADLPAGYATSAFAPQVGQG